MNALRHGTLCLTLLAGPLLAGCAPAYRSYSGCQIPCRYCAPGPLPYIHYPNCVCHSCAAQPYLGFGDQPVDQYDLADHR